ncbi:hypothetical protein EJ05DRAFT_479254 [Pseudovirgaria hyperparasitica]|uniref:Uncharacterized protein n=1 Tax=Pseudovirgaria hyperparasitica TaxID=470096 RepID=A0A6A6VXD5_9PEZI|nr:uncharacterized protein EJ05DRAFT_479254 [Pseudovirgaria hyperparasitica]KAF2754835.1 hypothetical protein EJ05DRAFT_479254 [Pseudovirgaria hyperparasitica]
MANIDQPWFPYVGAAATIAIAIAIGSLEECNPVAVRESMLRITCYGYTAQC